MTTRSETNKRYYLKHKDQIRTKQKERYWEDKKAVYIKGPDDSIGLDVLKLIQADLTITELMAYLFVRLNRYTRVRRDLKKLNLSQCADVLGISAITLSRLQRKAKNILAQ